jgi:excisionase family DNA binding protein
VQRSHARLGEDPVEDELVNSSVAGGTVAYRPAEAGRAIGVSRSRIYELLAQGELTARKLGGATLILRSELERYVARLPKADIGAIDER